MASAFVMAAVRARISDPANGLSGYTVFYQDEAFEPPLDLSPFVMVEYAVARSEQLTLGGPGERQFRDTGAIRFVVCMVIGSPVATIAAMADQFRTAFRALRFGADGAATLVAPFVETDAPSPAVPIGEDGAYYKVSSSVPYFYDYMA